MSKGKQHRWLLSLSRWAVPEELKGQGERGKTDAQAKRTGENLRGREIRLDTARGFLSFIEVSAGPEGGVACCLTFAALSPPVEGVMAEVKLRVPGGERGSPSTPVGSMCCLRWHSGSGTWHSGPDVPWLQLMPTSWCFLNSYSEVQRGEER